MQRVNKNKNKNLPVPMSYFSEKNSWRYEYFTLVYIFFKKVKYTFLHQFCSDLHETSTVRFRISYPLKGHCDYISAAPINMMPNQKYSNSLRRSLSHANYIMKMVPLD